MGEDPPLAPDDVDRLQPRRPGAPLPFEGRARGARADQTTVRRANLGIVLRQIAAARSCSRAEVAAVTGLTRGTVSSLVNELVALELVHETGETAAPRGVGRPGQSLELADVVVGVGLEINLDYVAVSLEDLTGAVRYERRSYADNRGSAPGPVLDHLGAVTRAALDAAARDGLRPIGISAAVPGLVEEASGTVVFAPNLGWHGIPVAAELESRLSLAVHVENESNLAALAEHWTGAAAAIDDFVCVFGEVGVGGGVVLGGRLFRGTHGFGGEFGHVTVDADGRRCACGSRGCVETVVGQEAIAASAGLPISGRTRSLTDELVRHAEAGSPEVLRALSEAGHWLGIALASTFNLLDLQAVVLGGCFGPLSPWLAADVRRTLEERSLAARSGSFVVLPSAFADGAAVRGAAALSLRRVLEAPWAVGAEHDEPVRSDSIAVARAREVGAIGRS